jgi:hypothetical protein
LTITENLPGLLRVMLECFYRASSFIAGMAAGFPLTTRGNDGGCAMILTSAILSSIAGIAGMAGCETWQVLTDGLAWTDDLYDRQSNPA